MWQITSPRIERATLDFSALDFSGSGQSKRTVNQLYDNDVKLINGIELVNWEDKDLQFIVCEVCGFVGCQLYNWVTLKRGGDIVIKLSSFKNSPLKPLFKGNIKK